MKIKILVIMLIISIACLTILWAQNDDTKEPTVEELYLKNPDLQIAKEKAASKDRDMKLEAIEDIKEIIEKGKDEEAEVQLAIILGNLASEGTTLVVRELGRVINYFPEVRQQACTVLGSVQSSKAKEAAKNILIDVVLKDDEPMVKAGAAYALGKLGLNQDNEVVSALAEAILKQDAIAPDNSFALAVIISIEQIAEANNGINDPYIFQALVKIAQSNYLPTVKQRAMDALSTLRGY